MSSKSPRTSLSTSFSTPKTVLTFSQVFTIYHLGNFFSNKTYSVLRSCWRETCWTRGSTKGNCRLVQREQHRAAEPSAFLPLRKPQCCVSCVLSKRASVSVRVIWGFEVWSTVATVTHVCRQGMWSESEFNQGGLESTCMPLTWLRRCCLHAAHLFSSVTLHGKEKHRWIFY